MMLDPRVVARALGGNVSGRNILAPGPGHSRVDRSLSIKIEPTAPDGFVVHSFAGDSPLACRDYVRAAIGLGARQCRRRQSSPKQPPFAIAPDTDADGRWALALRLWNESRDPRSTIVAHYLASRGLTLPDVIAGEVIRFHPALKFDGTLVGGMMALFRDNTSNAPCGIHRTYLDSAGRKLGRKMLGRARGAAIKLDADEHVTLGLNVSEGLESGLAAWLAGFRPVWALGCAANVRTFPVLAGVDCLTLIVDNDASGTGQQVASDCSKRWTDAGREVFRVVPDRRGDDFNDVIRRSFA